MRCVCRCNTRQKEELRRRVEAKAWHGDCHPRIQAVAHRLERERETFSQQTLVHYEWEKFDKQNKMKKARRGNQKRACERQNKLVRAAATATAVRTSPAATTTTAAGAATTTTPAAGAAATTTPAARTASTTVAAAWGGVGA